MVRADVVAQAMDVLAIIERYYPRESERYRILRAHSEDVASLALELAEHLPEGAVDKVFVYEGAMLHDIGIFLTNAEGIDCHGSEPYIRHGYLGAELLRSLGLERHARVAERHTGSGLTMEEIREKGIDLPEGIYTPQTMEECLICYADKFYSKTKLGERKALDAVRRSMAKRGEAVALRFERLHEMFAGAVS